MAPPHPMPRDGPKPRSGKPFMTGRPAATPAASGACATSAMDGTSTLEHFIFRNLTAPLLPPPAGGRTVYPPPAGEGWGGGFRCYRVLAQVRRMDEKGGRMAPFSFREKFFYAEVCLVTSPCFGKEQPYAESADETHRVIFDDGDVGIDNGTL